MILLVSLLLFARTGTSLEEARRSFERGDYPAAETALERVLASLPPGSDAERAALLPRLAEVRALQGDFLRAAEAAEEALRAPPAPTTEARRAAAFVYVRSHRYEEALPHIETLLRGAPDDAALRFWRGTVLSRRGRFAEALEDLAAGLRVPGGGRDARFELALALSKLGRPREALDRLLEILEDDPWDAEACHQASRQLLRIGGPGPSRAAANLVRWFEAIREAEGASSRDRHLAFQGKPALAALERAARAERLGRYDRALEEVERAKSFEGGAAQAASFEENFWARRGMPASAAARHLEDALGRAEAAKDDRRAQEAARLLLARSPGSARALRSLAASASDPILLPIRIHYLKRLAAADPENAAWKAELEAARRAFRGVQ